MAEPWTTSASASLASGSVTIVDGSAFCISDRAGDCDAELPHGFFYRDTRFLSQLRLRVNGTAPEPLSATTPDPFSAAYVARVHPRPGRADSHLLVFRHRYVGRGMREDLEIHNYGVEAAHCAVELDLGCDFADLFEVKEGRVTDRGALDVHHEHGRLTFSYRRNSFRRATRIEFSEHPEIDGRTARWTLAVPPGASWSACVAFVPVLDGTRVAPAHPCGTAVEHSVPSTRLEVWRARTPAFSTDHPGLGALLHRSIDDLAALRIFDPGHPERAVVAAGAPWFMTLFGRDSLLTSWMTLLVDRDLAIGTLETLAQFQGTDVDPITEEEPGRILHEMRFGEAASLSLGGGNVYYGTVDATPLFVMLVAELERWGCDRAVVDALIPAADRALEWIRDFGDRDGDGYVEYLRTTDRGLEHQGWKDSWDAIRAGDGTLARPPVALCEVQGYVYAAWRARADLAARRGDDELAARLRADAAGLRARFNRDFWVDDDRGGFLALGLDAAKRPLDAVASNMGHCLWTGILDEERAAPVAQRLVADSMFTGWGIRTLDATMAGYNPISYHNGSVWPHDNALCVAGLVRYGFVEEAQRVVAGLVDASSWFGSLLPELFAGLPREPLGFPVSYPTSCSPQAWAAASPLLLLRSMLRLEPDSPARRIHLAPAVPEWVGQLRVDGIEVAGGRLDIEVAGERVQVRSTPDGTTVVDAPRPVDG